LKRVFKHGSRNGEAVMTADAVLRVAREGDIRVQVDGEVLAIDTPTGTLTDDLRAAFRTRKATLLDVLAPVHQFIDLRDGPTVPAPALVLAISSEARRARLSH
jgi:tubulysin polyketide synthase-like protein